MAKRGRPTKIQSALNSFKSRPELKTPIADDLFLPNHSGDLSAGDILTTPTQDYDPVNKKYVDAQFPVTHASTTGQTTDDHHAKSHAHDGVDGSGTVDHADLSNLNWAAAAHTMDADLDMNGFNIIDIDTLGSIEGDAEIDLNAAENIFWIKPGSSAGNNYLIIKSDTDGACCPHLCSSVNGEGQLGDSDLKWDTIWVEKYGTVLQTELDTLTDGSSTTLHNHTHANATGQGVDDHHAESHTIASHSDTTGTGGELDDLTDNSMADTLHRHSELSASDGTPDQAVAVDAVGIITTPNQSGGKAYQTGTAQTIATATWTKVRLDATDWDIQSEFDVAVNSRWTATADGIYMITASVRLSAIPDTKNLQVGIYKNGGTNEIALQWMGAAGAPQVTFSTCKQLVATNYIELWCRHTSGGNETCSTSANFTYLTIQKIA